MFYEFYFLPVFAGAKCGLRGSQVARNTFFKRVRDTEHTLRGPFYLLKGRHGLSEILERGATYVSTVRHLPPGKLPAGPEKQSRAQLDAVEAAYSALDAASRGDDALAADIVALGVFRASQRRMWALLARNVTHTG